MPRANRFRHQVYRSERPTSPYHLLPAVSPTDPSSAEFGDQLAEAGALFGQAQVAAIYCVHGTFAGNDALGLLTELARFAPGLSKSLSQLGKRTVDCVAGESGNYTPEFVVALQSALSSGAKRTIPVRLFNWSSQNNHIGRADGAVRLLAELSRVANELVSAQTAGTEPPRMMLWGHSHGGNVLSLITNLLGADGEAREEFFHAARSFYRPWIRREIDMTVWQEVREILGNDDHALRHAALDIVSFGTPVRYGWDAGGYSKLLHFVHHRPSEGDAEFLAPHPIEMRRLLNAEQGDYVQQLGIAGTNFAPNPLALRTLLADWRLDRFLEQDLASERILTRLSHATRVPDEGTTLLVDYDAIEKGLHRHLAGHGVYTRQKWLPFHCREIARRFHGESEDVITPA